MRHQNFKTPRVISSIFIGALVVALAVFAFRPAEPGRDWLKRHPVLSSIGIPVHRLPAVEKLPGVEILSLNLHTVETSPAVENPPVLEIPPLAGHWLRTGQDKWEPPAFPGSPASLASTTSLVPPEPEPPLPAQQNPAGPGQGLRIPEPPVLQPEETGTALNRRTDSVNIMYIWSDRDQLKVISVTSFNRATGKAGIVVIPLQTVVNTESVVKLNRGPLTVRDLYREKGREGVRGFLAGKLGLPISNYIHVDQAALLKLSEIIGILRINGDQVTMAEAFEQTAAGLRTDDREVVRAVASQALKPRILLDLPELLWIFTRDIKTDFSTEQLLRFFYLGRQMDLQHMNKTALPGREHPEGEAIYLFVPDQTWQNIIYHITQ